MMLYLRRSLFKNIKKCKLLFLLYERISCKNELIAERNSYRGKLAKGKDIIDREKKLHHKYWKCGDFVYERYGLAYKNLSDNEILDYVPSFYHHKKLEKDHKGIDTVKYSNKYVQAQLFSERKIPCATTLAYCEKHVWYNLKNETVNIDWVINDAFTKGVEKLFIKPAGGQGGDGIFVIKYENGEVLLNGIPIKIIDLNGYLSKDMYLLQEGIIQSEQVMSINNTSVNTLRVIVQREGSRMIMKTCSMRIGRSGSDLDNSCQGGICIRVDTTSGQFDDYAKSRFDGIVFESHPDSGVAFKNIKINNWDRVKQLIENESSKLVEFNNIALDVALTKDGIKLIEFNFRYGIEHQQCVLGGVRRLLCIDNY